MYSFILILILVSSVHSKVNRVCTSTGQCGSCITNSDCTALTPYCHVDSMTCHQCVTDSQCRSDSDCNRTCVNWQCVNTMPPVICNTVNEVCYPRLGLCLTKCTSDAFCSTIPMALHYPNVGTCDNTTNRCFDCLTTTDCKPHLNISCGAQCIYSPNDFEYLCTNSDTCKNGKSCTLKTADTFQCSSSNILYISYILVLLSIFMML